MEDKSMTIQYAIAVFRQLLIDMLIRFDSLLVFSFFIRRAFFGIGMFAGYVRIGNQKA